MPGSFAARADEAAVGQVGQVDDLFLRRSSPRLDKLLLHRFLDLHVAVSTRFEAIVEQGAAPCPFSPRRCTARRRVSRPVTCSC